MLLFLLLLLTGCSVGNLDVDKIKEAVKFHQKSEEPEEQEMIILRYYQDMRLKDIAELISRRTENIQTAGERTGGISGRNFFESGIRRGIREDFQQGDD